MTLSMLKQVVENTEVVADDLHQPRCTSAAASARHALVVGARGASLAGGLDDFFHTEPPPGEPPATLVGSPPGHASDAAQDLPGVKPGDHIVPPYETTATAGMVEAWATSFHSTNRLITSKTFAQRVGLDDRVLPSTCSASSPAQCRTPTARSCR